MGPPRDAGWAKGFPRSFLEARALRRGTEEENPFPSTLTVLESSMGRKFTHTHARTHTPPRKVMGPDQRLGLICSRTTLGKGAHPSSHLSGLPASLPKAGLRFPPGPDSRPRGDSAWTTTLFLMAFWCARLHLRASHTSCHSLLPPSWAGGPVVPSSQVRKPRLRKVRPKATACT